MNPIFAIGHNDLRLFLRRRSAWVWLFLMPLVFVYFMGFAMRGPGAPANRKPPVLVENLDTNFLGRVFLEELGAQGMWLVASTNAGSAVCRLRLPPDFTARVLAQQPTKVAFSPRSDAAEGDAAIVELRLVRALIALNGHILETVTQPAGSNALTEAGLRAVMARPNPVGLEARFAGRKPVPSGFNFSLPGNLVMYLLMNLLVFGGASVAAERREGVLRRVLALAVRSRELVLGKIYGLMLLGAVQIVFLLAVGRLVFGVPLGANLPAVLLTLLVFAWVAASLGVLAGSLIPADDRIAAACVLASLLMAALGGCWWPLEMAPRALQLVALTLPTGWALQALHHLISFGSGFGAVLTPLAVLLGFGAAANLLAARCFRS